MRGLIGRKIYSMFNSEEEIKEHFSKDIQLIFAQNFFVYPKEITYLSMTKADMANYGMIDELADKVLSKVLDNFKDIDKQDEDSISKSIEETILSW